MKNKTYVFPAAMENGLKNMVRKSFPEPSIFKRTGNVKHLIYNTSLINFHPINEMDDLSQYMFSDNLFSVSLHVILDSVLPDIRVGYINECYNDGRYDEVFIANVEVLTLLFRLEPLKDLDALLSDYRSALQGAPNVKSIDYGYAFDGKKIRYPNSIVIKLSVDGGMPQAKIPIFVHDFEPIFAPKPRAHSLDYFSWYEHILNEYHYIHDLPYSRDGFDGLVSRIEASVTDLIRNELSYLEAIIKK